MQTVKRLMIGGLVALALSGLSHQARADNEGRIHDSAATVFKNIPNNKLYTPALQNIVVDHLNREASQADRQEDLDKTQKMLQEQQAREQVKKNLEILEGTQRILDGTPIRKNQQRYSNNQGNKDPSLYALPLFTCNYWLDINRDGIMDLDAECINVKNRFVEDMESVTVIIQNFSTETINQRLTIHGPKRELLYDYSEQAMKVKAVLRLSSAQGEEFKPTMDQILSKGGVGTYVITTEQNGRSFSHQFEIIPKNQK